MNLTSEKLYELCKKYGRQARLWRQKFIGLLPEVSRRKLYEEKGFGSVREFAAKLCGLSKEQVNLALNLGKRFENMPILKMMLENGEVSINKLVRIVSIATPENEEELAAKVKVLSVSALSTLVRDEKYAQQQVSKDCEVAQAQGCGGQIQMHVSGEVDGLNEPSSGPKIMHVHDLKTDCGGSSLNFQLESDVLAELNELNFKGIDVNALLREMLKKRKEEVADTKRKLADEQKDKEATRHVPVKIERILNLEYGTKCAVPNCTREARHIHHELPFAMVKNHNPFSMKPLCEGHHELSHSVDLNYHRKRKAAIG